MAACKFAQSAAPTGGDVPGGVVATAASAGVGAAGVGAGAGAGAAGVTLLGAGDEALPPPPHPAKAATATAAANRPIKFVFIISSFDFKLLGDVRICEDRIHRAGRESATACKKRFTQIGTGCSFRCSETPGSRPA